MIEIIEKKRGKEWNACTDAIFIKQLNKSQRQLMNKSAFGSDSR